VPDGRSPASVRAARRARKSLPTCPADTRSGILDRDVTHRHCSGRDQDAAAGRRELDCVGQEIEQDLLRLDPIRPHHDIRGTPRASQPEAFGCACGSTIGNTASTTDCMSTGVNSRVIFFAESAVVEQVVDDAQQMLLARADRAT